MSALLLAVVVSVGVVGDTPGDHIAWWKRHLRPRTLVRYGACGQCSKFGGYATGSGYDYRVEFDYPWYLNRRRPSYPPVINLVNPLAVPATESVPESIAPPAATPALPDE